VQMLFELHGLVLALHHDARFLRLPGAPARAQRAFERVLSHYVSPECARPTKDLPARATARRR